MDLAGKVAFVTGAASGIGFAMAEAFVARGMKVALADIEKAALAKATGRLEQAGATVAAVAVDVTDRAAMEDAASAVEGMFGGVDLVCNNAGVVSCGALDAVTYQDWDWILGVNLGGVINGVMTFVPRLKARGGGHIVNTASMVGLIGMESWGVYAASKFAVVGLSESLRLDLAPHRIGVSVLCPGLVATELLAAERNRPAVLSNRGAPAMPPSASGAEAIRTLNPSEVIEPRAVGEQVADAIERNALYICTHPEYRQAMIERHATLLSALDRHADV